MGIDVTKCQTRIAMPAFDIDTFNRNAVLLARCLDLSGWNDPTLILKVREPHANTLGLFTAGKNAVQRNGAGECWASKAEMLEDDVFQNSVYMRALRQSTVIGTFGNRLTVMVVDIGAYTTDLAKLTFDFTAPADGLRTVPQVSYELGIINELDKLLFPMLEKRHGFSWFGNTFQAMENYKMLLYLNQPWQLQTRVNGNPVTIELGTGEEFELVENATKRFATAVWEKIAAFTAGEMPSHVYLTGGGTRIKNIAETLRQLIEASGMRVVFAEKASEANGTENQRSWSQTGETLQRLATAVGGASVFFQEAAAPVLHGQDGFQQLPTIVAETPAGYKTCRCQGGNKDCCFCDGRGFYAQG